MREGFPLVGTQRNSALHKDAVAASNSCEFKIRTSLCSWPEKSYPTGISAPGRADKLVGGTSRRRPHARTASTMEAQQTGGEGGKMQSVASLLPSVFPSFTSRFFKSEAELSCVSVTLPRPL